MNTPDHTRTARENLVVSIRSAIDDIEAGNFGRVRDDLKNPVDVNALSSDDVSVPVIAETRRCIEVAYNSLCYPMIEPAAAVLALRYALRLYGEDQP